LSGRGGIKKKGEVLIANLGSVKIGVEGKSSRGEKKAYVKKRLAHRVKFLGVMRFREGNFDGVWIVKKNSTFGQGGKHTTIPSDNNCTVTFSWMEQKTWLDTRE